MKCALVISGQPKFLELGYKYIKENIINVNSPDVFLHAWHSPSDIGKSYGGVSWSSNQDTIRSDVPERILQLYNPVYFDIEPQKYDIFPNGKSAKDYPDTQGENIAFANYSMFYSMYKAMELCTKYEYVQKFKYDVVIRCRFDSAPLDPIDLMKYEITSSTNEIQYADACRNPNVISDWIFWSTSMNMRYMCSTYLFLDRYVFDENIMLCGEEILTHHLKKINTIRVPKPISTFLLRDWEFKNKNFGRFH